MASAKSSPVRRGGSGGGSSKEHEQAVSPARWAGVSLVIAAIVAAIVLAMVSSSEPSGPADAAILPAGSPTPSSSASDLTAMVPKGQPRIVNPVSETTSEVDFPMTVELPAEDLPRQDLKLLIFRGTDKVGELEAPKTGGTVIVPSVRVDEGENVLVAVLTGTGGPGPQSEPITLLVDRQAQQLAITAPENKVTVYDDTVTVEGTADVGARVEIVNETTGDPAVTETVGNSGTFDASIKLKPNATNKITASTTDDAGLTPSKTVRVVQVDGRPNVKIRPVAAIDRSALPTPIRIVVAVTDEKGKPLEEAQVDFSLGGADRTTVTETIYTDPTGKAVWKPTVEKGSSTTTTSLQLSVTATSPTSGKSRQIPTTIDLR